MILYQKFHIEKIYRMFKTDFWLFETSIWLHVFGRSMISVFIPIFMLTLGYSVSQVMLYYFLYCIFDLPLNFLARQLTFKYGARKVIILGTLSYIFYFILFLELSPEKWLIFILMAFFLAMYDTMYWISHIYFFMKCSPHKANISRDTGFLYIAKRIAGILAPMIGAAVLILFTQKVLIIFSVIVLLFSIWPLFKIKDIDDKPKKKPLGFRQYFRKGKRFKDYFVTSLFSFHSVAENLIWPIFIFITLKSMNSVAIIPVIVSISTIIFTYFTSHIKNTNRRIAMAVGAFFIALVWILRIFFDSEIFLFASIFLVGFFGILITIPLDSNLYEKGEEKDPLAASTYRNIFSMFPRIFIYGILYLLFEIFHVSFLLAAVTMFAIMLLNLFWIMQKKRALVKDG